LFIRRHFASGKYKENVEGHGSKSRQDLLIAGNELHTDVYGSLNILSEYCTITQGAKP